MAAASHLLVWVGLCRASFAEPFPIDAPPRERRSDAAIAAEVGLAGASLVMGVHNGRAALRGEPSLAWSLAGIAVGVGSLSAAASSDAETEALDVAAGMGAVLTGFARLGREVRATDSTHALRIEPGYRSLRFRMQF